MANFSGSGGGRNNAQFVSPEFRNRSSGGFGAAAGMTDLAGAFQAQRQKAPRYDQMGANNISNRAAERAGVMKAEASVLGQGLSSIANVRSAEITADARVSAANKAASAAKWSNDEWYRLYPWSWPRIT